MIAIRNKVQMVYASTHLEPICSQCTFSLHPRKQVFWRFQGVEKGCIGHKWAKTKTAFLIFYLMTFQTSNADRLLLKQTNQIKTVILWPPQKVAWPPGSGHPYKQVFVLSAGSRTESSKEPQTWFSTGISGSRIVIATRQPSLYLPLKVLHRDTRIRCEICSILTIKTPERRQWRHSGVFIVKSEHISNLVLVFLLLILNM